MTSGQNPKIRLVRCPKCRQLLPERADLPVYKCGGCGTALQAKNKKNNNSIGVNSDIHKTECSLTNELDWVPEYKECSILIQEVIHPRLSEIYSGQNIAGEQNGSGCCNPDSCGSSQTCKEDQEKCSIDTSINSIEVHSSPEPVPQEREESLPSARANLEAVFADEENSKVLKEKSDSGKTSIEPIRRENEEPLLAEPNSEAAVRDKSSPFCEENLGVIEEKCHSEDSSTGPVHQENEEALPFVRKNSEAVADESLTFNEENSEVTNEKSGSEYRDLNNNNMSTGKSISNFSGKVIASPLAERIDPSHRSTLRDFDSIRSKDTFEATEYADANSELSGTLRDVSKSPTRRNTHAYDGSVSSSDEMCGQFFDHQKISFTNIYDAPNVFASADRIERTLQSKGAMADNAETHQLWDSISLPSDKRHYSMNTRNGYQSESLEPSNHGHPPRIWRTEERKDFPFRMHINQCGPRAGYENGSSSNCAYDDFQHIPSFHSTDRPKHPQYEKMELLRMVYELQGQLNTACNMKGKPKGRILGGVPWKEKPDQSYCKYKEPEEDICQNLSCPNYPGKCRKGSNLARASKSAQIISPRETLNSRYLVDQACVHCYPQDWHKSWTLPVLFHAGYNFYDPYSSCASSPRRSANSEFSMQSCEINHGVQRHRDHEIKMYSREKNNVVKKHFLPTAGGAPFITCYCCLKLVQLPADFLLFKRRVHRLRCGSCSKILKFSLWNGTHIIRYLSNAVDPQPSEVHKYGSGIGRKDLGTTFNINGSHVEPVSCSDDEYGRSFSTEGDPHYVAPLNKNDRKPRQGSSSRPSTERKEFVMRLFRKKSKNAGEIYGSTGLSSPLHWLMGYSSPSRVIHGSDPTTTGSFRKK